MAQGLGRGQKHPGQRLWSCHNPGGEGQTEKSQKIRNIQRLASCSTGLEHSMLETGEWNMRLEVKVGTNLCEEQRSQPRFFEWRSNMV